MPQNLLTTRKDRLLDDHQCKASSTKLTNLKCRTLCFPGSLDQAKVKGRIVVCTRGVNGRMEKGQVVKEAGGVGMVLCNDESTGESTVADPHVIPAAHCSFSQCKDLFAYLQSFVSVNQAWSPSRRSRTFTGHCRASAPLVRAGRQPLRSGPPAAALSGRPWAAFPLPDWG